MKVVQSTGRFGQKEVSGSSSSNENVPCDENGVQLTQTVFANTGFFTAGRATITANADACVNPSTGPCGGDSDKQVLTLRR